MLPIFAPCQHLIHSPSYKPTLSTGPLDRGNFGDGPMLPFAISDVCNDSTSKGLDLGISDRSMRSEPSLAQDTRNLTYRRVLLE